MFYRKVLRVFRNMRQRLCVSFNVESFAKHMKSIIRYQKEKKKKTGKTISGWIPRAFRPLVSLYFKYTTLHIL